MSGIPVEMLVDIEGPYDRFKSHSEKSLLKSDLGSTEQIDDPFEICSIRSNASDNDIGLELGLALEKSIKLQSQANWHNENSSSIGRDGQHMDLGILVNLDESPDKKLVSALQAKRHARASSKDAESAFNNPSNPFNLAWDVIEQEALNLADHIQYNKDKSIISPRKMVEMAMWQSPDSPLMSPTKHTDSLADAPFLIKSSPDLERRCNVKGPKSANAKGRSSLVSSPVVTKSVATPLKSRSSIQNSPLRKANTKAAVSSPVKTALPRTSFKTPLIRSSASVPLGCSSTGKPSSATTSAVSSKAVPMKAIHGVVHHQTQSARNNKPIESPVRRPSASSTPSRTPQRSTVSTAPSLSGKTARPPLTRAGSDLTQQLLRKTAASLQHQQATRKPSMSLNPMSQLPTSIATPATPTTQSKQRNPLCRTDSDAIKSTKTDIPAMQRQGSIRYAAAKRVSFSGASATPPSTVPLNGNVPPKMSAMKSSLQRLKPQHKENQEP